MKKVVLTIAVVLGLISCQKEITPNPEPITPIDHFDGLDDTTGNYAFDIIKGLGGSRRQSIEVQGIYTGNIWTTNATKTLQLVDDIPPKLGSIFLLEGKWSDGILLETGNSIVVDFDFNFVGWNYQSGNRMLVFSIPNIHNRNYANWNSTLVDGILTITHFNRVYKDGLGDLYSITDVLSYDLTNNKLISITQTALYNGNDDKKIYNGWVYSFTLRQ